jgi:5-methylcytosine-specific restriction endonuclease McrA
MLVARAEQSYGAWHAGTGTEMHSLRRPATSAESIFSEAVLTVHNKKDRARFAAEIPWLRRVGAAYEAAASSGMLPGLTRSHFNSSTVTVKEMRSFYSYRLRRKTAPQRRLYDELMAAPPHARCPYCGERRVKSLDHYLPLSTFSALSVTPTNLVPACSDCNKAKDDYEPTAGGPALLHPYFDDLDPLPWLQATISPGLPPAVTFRIDRSVFALPSDADRVQKHVEVFDLFSLFVSHAAQAVDELDMRLPDLYANGGSSDVEQYLLEALRYLPPRPFNVWRRALIAALAKNSWYCDDYAKSVLARDGQLSKAS